jgi:hypothetical protein
MSKVSGKIEKASIGGKKRFPLIFFKSNFSPTASIR